MAEHLSALDATFLELEEADDAAHMHIGAILVFDGPAPSIEEVRVEVLVDVGDGVRSFDIAATKAGRRVEVSTSRGTVEVTNDPALLFSPLSGGPMPMP